MAAVLDPSLTFEQFVVGPGNRLATAAARHAAETPGASYNPLVIVGPAGSGKTHLLTATAHLAHQLQADLAVRYETSDGFTDLLTAGLASGDTASFREAYTSLRLLLVDDLQQLAGRGRTQEELGRICEEMVRHGSQVVIASDRSPQEIAGIEPSLAAFLTDGLTVDLGPPNDEARLAHRAGQEEGPGEPGGDEFGAFLSDISAAVASVVEAAPWRRRLGESILRWEAEGIRTRRLEAALEADSAPDVESLLARFREDVERLRSVERELRELGAPVRDAGVFRDPARLAEAEALLAAHRPTTPARRPAPAAPETEPVDEWYFDREKIDWGWIALEDRLLEEEG